MTEAVWTQVFNNPYANAALKMPSDGGLTPSKILLTSHGQWLAQGGGGGQRLPSEEEHFVT